VGTGRLPEDATARSSIPLTFAEERHLVSQSKTNREIAQCLGISYATVKRHIENILRKLNVRNRVEAAIYALSLQRCPNGNGACPLEHWWRKIT
jgi:DNA-binding CsgD family transcriptional regulator